MPEKIKCNACDGTGVREYLVNQHGDEKEKGTCNVCKGVGHQYHMTDEEEDDYHNDYW